MQTKIVDKEKIKEMRKNRKLLREIAEFFGVTIQRIHQIIKRDFPEVKGRLKKEEKSAENAKS